MVVLTGLEPVVSLTLGQVRNSRLLSLPLGTLLCSPRFRLASSATGGASAPRPIDVPKHIDGTHWFQPALSEYQKKRPPLRMVFSFGGAYWTRTSDPIDVNDVLYRTGWST